MGCFTFVRRVFCCRKREILSFAGEGLRRVSARSHLTEKRTARFGRNAPRSALFFRRDLLYAGGHYAALLDLLKPFHMRLRQMQLLQPDGLPFFHQ